jgi:hypothetical protein
METVIPWATVDPAIRSDAPFVGVVIIDPARRLCISDLVSFEAEQLANPLTASGEILAAAQQAAVRLVASYRRQASADDDTPSLPPAPNRPAFRVLEGGRTKKPVRRSGGPRVRLSPPATPGR